MDKPNSYDEVPYWGNPYRESHPDHLATMARLFGLTSPAVNHCRVLELGCSNAANLIPMAVALPESTFVGIDLSQRQVEAGQTTINNLGLKNIELIHGSIDTIGPDRGLFDYIICHGVYSWVPRSVQDHILHVCNVNLSANGIAYVSYNTHPGWFMRGMVRRMMKFHARRFSNPQTQLEQARALLDFLFEASSGVDPTYHALLSRELNILRHCNDSYLYHEHLEENNEPLFFHEFIERAEREGLRYLAEPHLGEMVPTNIPPEIASVLGQVGPNIIEFEQYLDFLKNRTFRRTLLCHSELIPNREIQPESLLEFRITSHLKRRGANQSLIGTDEWEFVGEGDLAISVTSPVHKAVLTVLERQFPTSVTCTDLAVAAQTMIDDVAEQETRIHVELTSISELILQLYLRQFFEISVAPPRFRVTIANCPHGFDSARLQAVEGTVVTNLKHQRVQLGPLDQQLLRFLDGRRDRDALVAMLDEALTAEKITLQNESGLLPPEARTKELVSEILDQGLQNLARQALLMV